MKNIHDYALLLSTIRQCAYLMLESSSYVRKELPLLDIPEDLRAQINGLCENWLGTKHDLISELFDAEEDVDADRLAARCGCMMGWIEGHVMEAHEVIQNLDAATKGDSAGDLGGALLLVTESAFNVLNSYNESARLLPE